MLYRLSLGGTCASIWRKFLIPEGARDEHHVFVATLTASVCAILQNCRGDSAIGQWLSEQPLDFLHAPGFWRRPSTASEARKLLSRSDVTALEVALTRWIHDLLPDSALTTYLVSLSRDQADAARLLQINRQHWTIENGVFYIRDETFSEDRSRSRTRSGPQLMAALRNAALSLLRLDGSTNISASLRSCSWNTQRTRNLLGIL